MDNRSAYVNKLQGELRMAFPQYLGIFSKVTINTSLTLLETYTSPSAFLEADKQEIIDIIKSTARFGLTYAQNKYNAIIQAATDANQFGYIIESNIKRIRLYISFIRKYDEEINDILESLHKLVDSNEDTKFVKQVHLIETFKGAGFLSAATIMGEIGDFSAFSKPKQLFAYFGLDPAVKQSGKFEGTKVQMSKRGSSIARRVIHTLSLQSISISRNGKAKNPVLREYYLQKCDSKPKLVAMGAVSHKVCNMIFAILRDIIIKILEDDNNYYIYIQNNNDEISVEHLPEMFPQFYQTAEDDTILNSIELKIAQHLASLHQIKLTTEKQSDKYTVFKFTISK